MKKAQFSAMALTLGLMALVSCNKDKESKEAVFTATLEQHVGQQGRTAINPENGMVKWLASDKILISNGNGTQNNEGGENVVCAKQLENNLARIVRNEVKCFNPLPINKTPEPPVGPQGIIKGTFTINATDNQVYFSQGNLLYIGIAATPYWKFADHQWDYLGTTISQNSSDENVDHDHFAWGTKGYNHGVNAYQPWSTSTSHSDYWEYGKSNYYLYSVNGQANCGYNASSDAELYFHNAVSLIFKMVGFYTETERHTSDGRMDMVVQTANYIYLFEFKLDKSVGEALEQIERKQYAAPFANDPRKLYKIGVNFSSATRRVEGWKVV